jgi:hypothetical protein
MKLFKNTSVRVTYMTHNNINRLLSTQNHTQQDKYKKSGIYKLTFLIAKKHMLDRQTDRPFSFRLRKNFQDYKYANSKSKFTEHVLDHHHSFGPMNTTMDILHLISKRTMMNTLKRFHIYNETNRDNQINEPHIVKPNSIVDSIIHLNSDQGLPTLH